MYLTHERDLSRGTSESVRDVSGAGLQKAQLRSFYQDKLNSQNFFSLIEKSSRLSEQFFQFVQTNASVFQRRFIVSFYPFDSEPQLNIEKEARDEPYQVAYVRIVDWKAGLINVYPARRDMPEQWEEYFLKNGMRIYQPAAHQMQCSPSEVAVVIVPGLAFTPNGSRLGRGVGFYDRFLLRYPEALRMGIGFEDQMTAQLPTDPWDQGLDVILTDQAVYETQCYSEWKIHGRIGSRSP